MMNDEVTGLASGLAMGYCQLRKVLRPAALPNRKSIMTFTFDNKNL